MRKQGICLTAAWSVALLLGGGSACERRAHYPPMIAEGSDTTVQSSHTLDDRFMEMARQVPGFAGVVLEEGHEVTLLADPQSPDLSSPGQKTLGSDSAAVVNSLSPAELERHLRGPQDSIAVDPVSVRAAQQAADVYLGVGRPTYAWPKRTRRVAYSFDTLQRWRRALEDGLSIPWTTSDIDERENLVVFGVSDPNSARGPIHAHAAALGIPRRAVKVVGSPPLRTLATLDSYTRPAVGGLAIWNYVGNGFWGKCTIGFNAYAGATRGFVTASHCTTSAGLDGTVFYQGLDRNIIERGWAAIAPYRVGVEAIDPNFIHSSQFPSCGYCPTGHYCRWSDAAFVAYDAGITSLHAAIARPTGYGSLTVNGASNPYRIIQMQTYPLVGQVVHKVGIATGLVRAAIAQTCVDATVQDKLGVRYTFLCQELAQATDPPGTPGGLDGDSGGPIFFDLGGFPDARLVGIHMGQTAPGNFVMSSMWNIQMDLGGLAVWLTF